MNYKDTFRTGLKVLVIAAISVTGLAVNASAQEPAATPAKPAATERTGGRDMFKKYEIVRKPAKPAPSRLEPPSIQVRIEQYRAQKMVAANAHLTPPKPTTALLLNEMQVTGIFRTPRGWAAMVEATPIKLSYVIYPGENFFDGQLVAIEEGRLTFRRDIVWTDGRREKAVEVKPLRAPNPIEAMTATKSAPTAPAAEAEKPAAPEKP